VACVQMADRIVTLTSLMDDEYFMYDGRIVPSFVSSFTVCSSRI